MMQRSLSEKRCAGWRLVGRHDVATQAICIDFVPKVQSAEQTRPLFYGDRSFTTLASNGLHGPATHIDSAKPGQPANRSRRATIPVWRKGSLNRTLIERQNWTEASKKTGGRLGRPSRGTHHVISLPTPSVLIDHIDLGEDLVMKEALKCLTITTVFIQKVRPFLTKARDLSRDFGRVFHAL